MDQRNQIIVNAQSAKYYSDSNKKAYDKLYNKMYNKVRKAIKKATSQGIYRCYLCGNVNTNAELLRLVMEDLTKLLTDKDYITDSYLNSEVWNIFIAWSGETKEEELKHKYRYF